MRVGLALALVVGIIICAVAMAVADIPRLLTYQGRLTDDSGNPVADGDYILVFDMYDDSTAGTLRWVETQTVTVLDGLFNVQLGVTETLDEGLFASYPNLFLGLNISGQPQMAPRTRLTSSAFSFHALSVADNAIASSAIENGSISTEDIGQNGATDDQVLVWETSSWIPKDLPTGDITGVTAGSGLTGGGTTGSVTLNIGKGDGITVSTNSIELDAAYTDDRYVDTDGDTLTGSLNMDYPTDGHIDAKLTGNVDDGAYLLLNQEDGTSGISLFGGSTTNGSEIHMYNAAGTQRIKLDADAAGNSAAQLPEGAISDTEIQDEPGIAADNNSQMVTLTDEMLGLISLSITIPTSGYIVVEGKCYGKTLGTTGRNQGYVQIDETLGGNTDYPYYMQFGLGNHAGTATNFFPVYVTRVYQKSAGTYTFHMEGIAAASNAAGAVTETWDHMITATFYPTSYGSVSTLVSSSEASQFENAIPETVTRTDLDGTKTTQTLYRVDLRELELKEARLEAELEKTRRELLEARQGRE